ncbi:16792_t:CDS:10 [Funneliformis caledonium]|uniref:Replication protein A subunit n=1 Tax=Funneliformis caledonium TaxID=1117310 RepID=A0A9N9DRM2_9GLOM|nr:16792_t:CDS:10 [Funneliformis caledonium]
MNVGSIISLGCIQSLLDENETAKPNSPVLQLVRVNPGSSNSNEQGGSIRYKIGLSDGFEIVQGIIPDHLIKSVCNGKKLDRGMIIKLTNYTVSNSGPIQAGRTSKFLVITGFQMVKDVPLELYGHDYNRLKQRQDSVVVNRDSTPQRNSNNNSDEGICTIDNISPYHNKWKLKAMVIQKSDLRTWTNARGSGKLFNVTLMDNSGEIRATAFNQQAEEYANLLQLNKVYYISKGKVNIAKKQFSNVQNDYEITIEASTVIEPADDLAVPIKIKIDPVKISDLINYEKDQTVDVVAAIKEISETTQITTKAQKMIDKRDIIIVDDSGYEIRLTTWGQQVNELRDVELGTVVICKNARVGDFQGKNLSMYGVSRLMIDPDIPQTYPIRLERETSVFASNSYSGSSNFRNDPEKTIAQIVNENIGHSSEKAEYFVTRGTIVFIKKESMFYAACPTDGCNKKVIEDGENSYRCEKCSRSFDHVKYRYIFGINVSDHTDGMWFHCFNETGSIIMGKEANELNNIKENDESFFEDWIDSRFFKTYIFKCRAKMENYQEKNIIKYHVTEVIPVDFVEHGKALLNNINELETS